jgi:hypothetical protein
MKIRIRVKSRLIIKNPFKHYKITLLSAISYLFLPLSHQDWDNLKRITSIIARYLWVLLPFFPAVYHLVIHYIKRFKISECLLRLNNCDYYASLIIAWKRTIQTICKKFLDRLPLWLIHASITYRIKWIKFGVKTTNNYYGKNLFRFKPISA